MWSDVKKGRLTLYEDSSIDDYPLAGLGAWHVTGDRSNAGGVVGSVTGAPGTTDEVFLAAQEAAQQAHRDSQGRLILANFHLSPTPVTIGTHN